MNILLTDPKILWKLALEQAIEKIEKEEHKCPIEP